MASSSRKSSGMLASSVLLLITILQNGDAGSVPNNFDGCEEVFVGAGWAGVYSFYRRILDDPDRGPKACLFEESWRIGGRTYSVSINHTTPNFVQDVGAYRFSPDMHLPGDLIMKDLGIVTECYASDCPDATTEMPEQFLFNYSAPLRRVIDPETNLPAGYVTPIERMIEISKEFGGRVFTQTPLVGWTVTSSGDDDSTVSLEFEDRRSNASSAIDETQIIIDSPSVVVLNLPRNKLFEIQGVETSLEPDMAKILKCIAFDTPPDLFGDPGMLDGSDGILTLEKAYVYYSDAWWRTILNRNEGFWPNEEFGATPTSKLCIHYLRPIFYMHFNHLLRP